MMNSSEIVSLVGSLGFPIVCCMAMFWYINKTMKEFSDKLEESIASLTKSLTESTTATSQLVTTVELLAKFNRENSQIGVDENG